MNFGKFALRVLVGGLFVGHGMQKLAGWFGGKGLEGTDTMMRAIDMYPVRRNSIAAGATEAVSGGLLVLGLATPVAAAGLISTMLTAIRKVHGKNGPWNANRGWELNAIIIAAVTTLVEAGPGKVSLDAARGRIKSGPGWALAALAAGAIGSSAAIELGRRAAQKAALESTASGDADSDATADLAERAIARLEEFTGTSLSGRTILVIGLGPVGSQAAQLAKSRGMRVLAVNRIGQTDLPYVDEIRTSRFLGDLLPVAHAVILALPLNEKTRLMIDASTITRMRVDSFIINVGSVDVLDSGALLAAVADGRVAGAALDIR